MATTPSVTLPAAPSPVSSRSTWQLARTAINHAASSGRKTILTSTFAAPTGAPLAWLCQHGAVPSVYWRSRDGWEYAGIGVAHAVSGRGTSAMHDVANEAVHFAREQIISEPGPSARRPRFFGGFTFDPAATPGGDWLRAGFGDALLILPEVTYIRRDEQSYVVFAFEVTPRTTPEDLVERLAILNTGYWRGFDASLPQTGSIRIRPFDGVADRATWIEKVRSLVKRIDHGEFDKLVLARRIELQLPDDALHTSPWALLGLLKEFDSACYQFGFHWVEGGSFIGASPECLLKLQGNNLTSEALAGTVTRGHSDVEESEHASWLSASIKDELEHRYAAESIDAAFRQLANGSGTSVRGPEIVKLRTLLHLKSTFTAQVRNEVTLGDILAALHPTAAVAGTPSELALEAIRTSETHGRGWYGGPVGWVGADAAEFAVGIRSALLADSTAWLYAGAGLVHGSIPEEEWQETQDKLQAFQSAITASTGTV